jgi:membrane protein
MGRIFSAARALGAASLHFQRDRGFDRAAVIAYFALLSFIPLAVVLVAVGALALGSVEAAERGTELLLRNIVANLPPQLMTQVRELQERVWSGLSYLLLAVWSGSRVFSKIQASLDFVFRARTRRPWALRKILSFALVGVLSAVLVATVVVGSILGAVDRFIDTTALAPLRDIPWYLALSGLVTRYLIPWALAVVSFSSIYKILPARPVPLRAALIAGGVAGTLWEGLKVSFTYYVSHVASYRETYGALAAVVVFLVWVNLSAVNLLWGGELAAILAGARRETETQRPG